MEKKTLSKTGQASRFTLVGKAIVNDRTFSIDQRSQSSDYISNRMNLGVNCGSKYGNIYCELWGGYSENRDTFIYVHKKNADGSDDFSNTDKIAWEDRTDENILSEIGRSCFIKVGVENTTKGEIFTKEFLSPYDAINYLNEHLKDGTRIRVNGRLKYDYYNGNVRVRKEITRIEVVNNDVPDSATFVQSILLTKGCAGAIDKKTGLCPIDGIVLEYFKTFNNKEVNGCVPLHKSFEFDFSRFLNEPEKIKKIREKFFNVRKGITEIKFEGEFIESGSTVQITEDDLDDDIKLQIEFGLRTLEEALQTAAGSGSVLRRMVLIRPAMKDVEQEDGSIKRTTDITERKYEEDDLALDCLVEDEREEEAEEKFEKLSDDDEDGLDDWMSELNL